MQQAWLLLMLMLLLLLLLLCKQSKALCIAPYTLCLRVYGICEVVQLMRWSDPLAEASTVAWSDPLAEASTVAWCSTAALSEAYAAGAPVAFKVGNWLKLSALFVSADTGQ
jgi:hypothetical protein